MNVPQFNLVECIFSLCIPITKLLLLLLFSNIIGHPDDPLSVDISW